jgi:hypothetical protein
MPLPKYFGTVLDKNGNAVAGATVQVRITGTSTLVPLYQDDETTIISNPMTTTALGEYSFKTTDGEYDIVIAISGVTATTTKVRLYPVPTIIGAALITAPDAAMQRFIMGLATVAASGSISDLVGLNNPITFTGADLTLSGSYSSLNLLSTGTAGNQAAVRYTRSLSGSPRVWQLGVGIDSTNKFVLFDQNAGAYPLRVLHVTGELGLAVDPVAGNGLLQFPDGTTKATGMSFKQGSQTAFVYATSNLFSGYGLAVQTDYTTSYLSVLDSTAVCAVAMAAVAGTGFVGTFTNKPLMIMTNSNPAISIDTSQNVGIGSGVANAYKLEVTAVTQKIASFIGNDGTNGGYFSLYDKINSLTRGYMGYGPALLGGGALTDIIVKSNGAIKLVTNSGAALTVDATQGVSTIGARSVRVRSVASSAGTTVADTLEHVFVLTGSTTHTFTLPAATAGRVLIFKNRSTGALTINRAGSDTIDGGTTTSVAAGAFKTMIASGTDWCVTG